MEPMGKHSHALPKNEEPPLHQDSLPELCEALKRMFTRLRDVAPLECCGDGITRILNGVCML